MNFSIKNPYGFIYITTNINNGMRYIGQKKFIKGYEKYLGSGTYLRNAIKKYGRYSFSRDIVDIAYSKEELDKKEEEWIKNYNAVKDDNFYNVAYGGIGVKSGDKNHMYHNKHTEEARKKISISKKKYVKDKHPHAKKVILLNTLEIFSYTGDCVGYNKTVKCAKNIASCCRGESRFYGESENGQKLVWMFLDDFEGKKLSEFKIKEIIDKANLSCEPANKKRVVCLNDKKFFDTCKECSLYYGVTYSTIGEVCRGNKNYAIGKKTLQKHYFKFEEDYIGDEIIVESHKYINKKKNGRYFVDLKDNNRRYSKTVDTLQEAIEWRDDKLIELGKYEEFKEYFENK